MRLTIDSEGKVEGWCKAHLKRGDVLEMVLFFRDERGRVVPCPWGAVQFGAKREYDGEFLVYADHFEAVTVGDVPAMRGMLQLNTQGLIDLVQGEDCVSLMAEFQFFCAERVQSSGTLCLRIANDVIKGGEGMSLPAPGYWTDEQIRAYIDEVLKGHAGVIVGLSAYEIAVLRYGFVGTEAEWLESLRGAKGDDGRSAYEVAVAHGFVGTEVEWLESLKGRNGVDGKDGNGVFTGMVVWSAQPKDAQGNFRIPTGWLLCNGQAMDRTVYQALFYTIGGTYGVGNGTTTFNVPNLFDGNGRFIRSAHWSKAVGVTEGDAIRNIHGAYQVYKSGESIQGFSGAYNVYKSGATGGHGHGSQADGPSTLNVEFDAWRAVPVADENRPYNIALVPLIKF